MTAGGAGSAEVDGLLTTAQVAEDVVAAMRDETFLVLPHPEVLGYCRARGSTTTAGWAACRSLYARQAPPS
jgi:hypothetical protein